MTVVVRWLPYRARNGRVYFAHRANKSAGIEAASAWEIPADCVRIDIGTNNYVQSGTIAASGDTTRVLHEVLGDGVSAVNDVASWKCYVVQDNSKSPFKGERYYVNSLSGEKSFRCPPGCASLPPVNIRSSWLTFVDDSRGGQRYYQNKVSKEITWIRPSCLGPASESEPGNDLAVMEAADEQAANLEQLEGQEDQFQIPDDYEDLQFESDFEEEEVKPQEKQEEQTVTIQEQEKQASEEQDEAFLARLFLPKGRKRLDQQADKTNYNKDMLKRRFWELLDERGIQHYSQWCNWARKLSSDIRCESVPLETRARWFEEFRIGLIGNEKQTRSRRIKICRSLLREFCNDGGTAALKPCQHDIVNGDTKAFIQHLNFLRDDQSDRTDKGLLLRLHVAISTLNDKDRVRVLQIFAK